MQKCIPISLFLYQKGIPKYFLSQKALSLVYIYFYLALAENFAPWAENVLTITQQKHNFLDLVGKVLERASWEVPQLHFLYPLLKTWLSLMNIYLPHCRRFLSVEKISTRGKSISSGQFPFLSKVRELARGKYDSPRVKIFSKGRKGRLCGTIFSIMER